MLGKKLKRNRLRHNFWLGTSSEGMVLGGFSSPYQKVISTKILAKNYLSENLSFEK